MLQIMYNYPAMLSHAVIRCWTPEHMSAAYDAKSSASTVIAVSSSAFEEKQC
jgi:hypothetical protein